MPESPSSTHQTPLNQLRLRLALSGSLKLRFPRLGGPGSRDPCSRARIWGIPHSLVASWNQTRRACALTWHRLRKSGSPDRGWYMAPHRQQELGSLMSGKRNLLQILGGTGVIVNVVDSRGSLHPAHIVRSYSTPDI